MLRLKRRADSMPFDFGNANDRQKEAIQSIYNLTLTLSSDINKLSKPVL